MQINRVRKPKLLQQGSVFSLDNLSFNDTKSSKNKTMNDFYPEIDLSETKYGVVLSQTCDLFRDDSERRNVKLSHISIAFLEPFKKYIKLFLKDEDLNSEKFKNPIQIQNTEYIFVDQESIDKQIESKLSAILNNNHPWLYFISIKLKIKEQLYLVNISKILPLKVDHYDVILSNVKFHLKTEFANKLGWKIANFFGRVGTTDYTQTQKRSIAKNIYQEFKVTTSHFSQNEILLDSTEKFKKSKNLKNIKDEIKLLEEINKLT